MHMLTMSHSSWGDCMLLDLNRMRLTGAMCDVKISLDDDNTLQAHSCVLSAVSPFFTTVLLGAESPEMDFRDFPAGIIESVLQFIYTGELTVSDVDLPSLRDVATQLDIHSLVELVKKIPRDHTAVDGDADSETASVPSEPKTTDEPPSSEVISCKPTSSEVGRSSQLCLPDIKCEDTDGEDSHKNYNSIELDVEEFSMTMPCVQVEPPSSDEILPTGTTDLAVEVTDMEEVDHLNTVLKSQGINIGAQYPDDQSEETYFIVGDPQVMTGGTDGDSEAGQDSVNSDAKEEMSNHCYECDIAYTSDLRYHRHRHHRHGDSLPLDIYITTMREKRERYGILVVETDAEAVGDAITELSGPVDDGTDIKPETHAAGPHPGESPVRRSDRKRKKKLFGDDDQDAGTESNSEGAPKRRRSKKRRDPDSKEIKKTDQKFTCEKCFSVFKNADNLRLHEAVHRDDKPFCCSICGKSFKQSGNMRVHERRHAGFKPFVCTTCGRTFGQSAHLKSHMRVHTGEKPHQCSICGNRFASLTNLKSHIRRHTGEKPYKCTVCGQQFSQLGNLSAHQRRHKGVKPFPCTKCDKAFTALCNFQRHFQRRHLNQRPVHCPDCNKGFVNNSEMRTHHRNKHMRLAVPVSAALLKKRQTSQVVQDNREKPAEIIQRQTSIGLQDKSEKHAEIIHRQTSIGLQDKSEKHAKIINAEFLNMDDQTIIVHKSAIEDI